MSRPARVCSCAYAFYFNPFLSIIINGNADIGSSMSFYKARAYAIGLQQIPTAQRCHLVVELL
jgi:hypothetical protein